MITEHDVHTGKADYTATARRGKALRLPLPRDARTVCTFPLFERAFG